MVYYNEDELALLLLHRATPFCAVFNRIYEAGKCRRAENKYKFFSKLNRKYLFKSPTSFFQN